MQGPCYTERVSGITSRQKTALPCMLNSVEKNHNVNVYTFLAVTRATEQSEIKRGSPRDSARLHCHTIDICTKQRDVIIVIIPVDDVVPDSTPRRVT